eukprot:EG_transcript_9681
MFAQVPNKDMAPVAQRLRTLLQQHFDASAAYTMTDCPPEDVGLELHTMVRLGGPEADLALLLKSIWAAPGIPELFLTEPLLRVSRLSSRAAAASQLGDEATSNDQSAYVFAFLVFTFLVRSAVEGELRVTGCHDGVGKLRSAPFAVAAATRALTLFLDPRVRADCGDALAPGVGFLRTVMAQSQALREEALRLGAPFACLHEWMYSGSGAKQYCKDVLMSIAPEEWRSLPRELALDFLLKGLETVTWLNRYPEDDTSGDGQLVVLAAMQEVLRGQQDLKGTLEAAAGRTCCLYGGDTDEGRVEQFVRAAFLCFSDLAGREQPGCLADWLAVWRGYGPGSPEQLKYMRLVMAEEDRAEFDALQAQLAQLAELKAAQVAAAAADPDAPE